MRPSGLLQKGSELLLKHRSLVIGLILVSLGGVVLLIHLGIILDAKKPPRPSPVPTPAIQVELNPPSPKQEVASPPDNPQRHPPSVSPRRRPQSVHPIDERSQPSQVTTGKVVPVIVERRRSAVLITRDNLAKQREDSGTPIQAEQHRTEPPRKERVTEPNDAMPFFAPPVPPEGGINALIASTPQSDMKQALAGYIRTYYPLVTLDAASIKQLNPQGKAEYDRQKAALDQELLDSISGSIAPTPGGIDSGYPQELMEMLRRGGHIEGN